MNRWMNKHISWLSSCTCSEHLNSSLSSIIPYGVTFVLTDSISKPASFFSKTWEWYIPWNIWDVVDFTRQYLSNSTEKCLRLLVTLIVANISLGLLFAIVREAYEDPSRLNVDFFQFKETAPKIGCFCPKRKISFHRSFFACTCFLLPQCHIISDVSQAMSELKEFRYFRQGKCPPHSVPHLQFLQLIVHQLNSVISGGYLQEDGKISRRKSDQKWPHQPLTTQKITKSFIT